jgi:hypothetical protein
MVKPLGEGIFTAARCGDPSKILLDWVKKDSVLLVAPLAASLVAKGFQWEIAKTSHSVMESIKVLDPGRQCRLGELGNGYNLLSFTPEDMDSSSNVLRSCRQCGK